MRVAIVSNGYFWLPAEPGPSRIYEIACRFAEAGHETEVITTDYQHFQKAYRDAEAIAAADYPFRITLIHGPAYKKNIDPRRVAGNAVLADRIAAYLMKKAAEAGRQNEKAYDAVYCTIPSNRIAARVSEWCRREAIPFIVDIEDLWPEAMSMIAGKHALAKKAMDTFLKPLYRDAETAYRNASAVIGTSDDYTMRAFLHREENIPHQTVYVGCDLKTFDAGAREFMSEIEKPDDEYWVTYAGSIGTSYDIRTLVDAGKRLADEEIIPREEDTKTAQREPKKIIIRIMGTGPMKEELEAYAKEIGADNVLFMGYTDYPKMAAYLKKSDLTVNSFIKGAPQSIVNKVGDYLAAGIPMVNTLENPVFTSLVDRYGFGKNIPAEDADALCKVVTEMLSDREQWKQMAENARTLAEERFDRAAAYPEIIRITEDCVKMPQDHR